MNNIPQALPIPEDSIYLDQELKLSNRELIIKGLQKVLKEKKLDLPLGPALDLNQNDRLFLINLIYRSYQQE